MTFRVGDLVKFITTGERRTGQLGTVLEKARDDGIMKVKFDSDGYVNAYFSYRYELVSPPPRTPFEQMVHEYISAELK